MDKPKLLIVDDDETIRTQMKWALADEYDLLLAEDREAALRLFRKAKPPLVALDLGLPPQPHDASEGLKALSEILSIAPETKVLIISGNQERANALKAIEAGAYDFFTKPADPPELKILLRRALQIHQLEAENIDLRKKQAAQSFAEMVGHSPIIQAIFATIRKIGTTDAPVIIIGESGTGKELIARAIHQQSHRKDGPFVVINCGAIPGELLESELFGHEKGAFTGAHVQRKGKFEFAQGGTLFLDEIGDLPLPLQVKLLRFLQDHRVERIGGREAIPIDIRIVSATHQDLKQQIAEGKFREDLYYRLSVVTINTPPLRERGGDVLLLANLFLDRFTKEYKKKIKSFNPEAYAALQNYGWPGNVRELENKVKRAVIMAEGPSITPAELELDEETSTAAAQSLKTTRAQVERDQILQALAKNNWNISKAALDLGISRPTLHGLIRKYNIER